MLHKFTNYLYEAKMYQGYRMLAIDGSDLSMTTNPKDTDTCFQNSPDIKGYNLLHLNAMYDLCNKFYVDAFVQPGIKLDEHKALTKMVDRSDITDKVIVIADRGYESYNNFSHIEQKGWNYVIRYHFVLYVLKFQMILMKQLLQIWMISISLQMKSKKVECIVQEIYAKIIIYNFCEMITMHVIINRTDTRYTYQVNFTVAIQICKYFFRCCNNAVQPDVEH